MSLLQKINDPADIRSLNIEELNQLAEEIRNYIAETMIQTGGHYGSSTGAVELALAVHKVFNTPRDKIIWDVGHQAYAHKIITGRREAFKTLRTHKGISGLLKRNESIYDVFGAGHASTSISAALGFAMARDLSGGNEKVVAIIGDGSMTGGLAFEGLNNAGALKTDMLVILNDNAMSIAGNVGALSQYLNKIMTSPFYFKAKDDIEELISQLNEKVLIDKRFPAAAKIGQAILQKATKLKEGVKNMILPSLLFEELGFTYYGPVNAHNLKELITILERIKPLRTPVLLHVRSSKGKGSDWALGDPERGHAAVKGVDPRTGDRVIETSPAKLSWTRIFSDTLIKLAEKDEKIVAFTAAMLSGTGLNRFAEKFPKRCFDVGIAEGHAVVSAAGMAANGYKPIVTIYSTFLQRAFDMIIHDVCIQNLPVVFAIDRGGIVGDDGETHQGAFDIGYLRMIPNMTVMTPRNDKELSAMLEFALQLRKPVALRFPRGPASIASSSLPIEFGKSEIIRDGTDAVIFSFGQLANFAIDAAEILDKDFNISVAVVNMRFVKPLDTETVIAYAKKTGRIVTFEESALQTGAGSAVLEALADSGVKVSVRRIGIPDRFIEHGEQKIIREEIGLTSANLIETIKEMMVGEGAGK